LPFVQCGGYNSNFAARLLTSFTEPGGAYYSATLTANLYNGSTYFNIAPFSTGVDFWIKVVTLTPGTVGLTMYIPLDTTTATCCGGTCVANCWDHFSEPMPAATGTWVRQQLPWANFTRGGWGASLAPCSNTNIHDGCNDAHVLQLQWAASPNGVAASVNAEFWVDNVTFY
jgi:hypothetical protein